MDLLRRRTFQNTVFRVTKQEIETAARGRGRGSGCLSSGAGASPSKSRLFTQSLPAEPSQLLAKSLIYSAAASSGDV